MEALDGFGLFDGQQRKSEHAQILNRSSQSDDRSRAREAFDYEPRRHDGQA